jgi:hypothetical protein
MQTLKSKIANLNPQQQKELKVAIASMLIKIKQCEKTCMLAKLQAG